MPAQCTTSPLLSRQALFLQHSLYYGRVLCKTAAARAAALHTFICEPRPRTAAADVPTQCTTSPLLSRQSTFVSALLTSWLFVTQNCSSARSRAAHFHILEPRPRTAVADVPTQCTTSPLLSRQAPFLQHSLYYGRVLCKTAVARAAALHTFIPWAASKDGSCRRANTVHHFSLALTTSTFPSALLNLWSRVMQNCSSARSRVAHFHSLSRVQGRQLPTCQHSAPLLPCSHDKHFSFSTPYIMVACCAKLQ